MAIKKPARKSAAKTPDPEECCEAGVGRKPAASKAAKTKAVRTKKYVYTFGGAKTEGNAAMKNLLGGKGATWPRCAC